MSDSSESGTPNSESVPPNEKPVSLPHDDWKEALREFLRIGSTEQDEEGDTREREDG